MCPIVRKAIAGSSPILWRKFILNLYRLKIRAGQDFTQRMDIIVIIGTVSTLFSVFIPVHKFLKCQLLSFHSSSCVLLFGFFKSSPEDMLINFREKARKGERGWDNHQCERNINRLPLACSLTGIQNLSMCPGGNRTHNLSVYGTMLQPTEPQWPGLRTTLISNYSYCTLLDLLYVPLFTFMYCIPLLILPDSPGSSQK